VEWPPIRQGRASDIGGAIEIASALFPAGQSRRLVLLSDGNDTGGRALEAAARLARSGVEVWTVPLRNPDKPEVLVERVEVPARLKQGEPFDLSANLRSNVATKAKVRLYQSQFLIAEREMELKPGDNPFLAPSLRPEGSFVQFDVEVIPEQDTSLENNRGLAVASLRGQPRVLLVDGEAEKARPLASALQAERIQVDLRGPNGAPRTLEDLQQFDLFLLSDLSALTLSREQMELYRRWVQDFGGGFVLLGGENSFGVGGYFRTPIEQMLPVRMEHNDRQELPTVALLIVLDRSGSMTAQVAGQTKMALANQGAALALNVLSPRDYFGVFAVDTRTHVVAPLAKHGAKEPIAQKILSVTAGGGGIYIYTSLAESMQALRDINARIKHVILFSDAADAEEKRAGEQADGTQGSGTALELVSAMVSLKITTSVVALGAEQDKDTLFLRQLAERGQGRFYLTSDATTLPQIFSTETMKVTQSSMVEEPTQAVPVLRHALTAGIDWAQSPLLLGYNATKPKPTAEVLLATERGEPLLATWRYGLGQTAAFTSDAKARWAGEWLAWPGYGKFWAQFVRGLLRKSGPAAFEVTRRETGDRLELHVDAVSPEGGFRNRLPITIAARTPDDTTQSLTAAQDAPGSYRATIRLPEEGTTVINVSSPELPEGGLALAHTRSYPREFLSTDTNEALLREVAAAGGGKFSPAPGEVFAGPASATLRPRDVTNWLLMAALVLMPVDIYLRRRSWSGAKS
jgi:Ca-activated chloride channel homolog